MLYGVPQIEDIENSRKILMDKRGEEYVFPAEPVTPEEMADVLRKKLSDVGIGWSVVLNNRIVSKISVSGRDRTIYVNSALNYTAAEIQRLRVHEVEVHVYRGANGDRQPFRMFREGLGGYDEAEEGLAVMAEDVSGCLEIDTRQIKLYAARCLAVSLAIEGSFYDVFEGLGEFFPEYLAYRLAERVKRGIRDTSSGGAFTKGAHYVSGYRKLREYIANGGNLSNLYVGKVGLADIPDVEILIEEGVLERPKFMPGFTGLDDQVI